MLQGRGSRKKLSFLLVMLLVVICIWVSVIHHSVTGYNASLEENKTEERERKKEMIENKTEERQRKEEMIEKFFAEILSNSTSNSTVQFGKVSDYACNGDTCHINSRDISKNLISETPNDTFTSLPRTFLKV